MSSSLPPDAPTNESLNPAQGSEADKLRSDSSGDSDPESWYPGSGMLEQWHGIVGHIMKGTSQAFKRMPANLDLSTTSGQSAFQSYWRGIFHDIEKTIMAEERIPQHITSPPSTAFNIFMFTQCGPCGGCPCDMPQPNPNIRIKNPDGVKKGDVIKAITAYLYGSDDKLPVIFDMFAPEDDDEDPEPDEPNTEGITAGPTALVSGDENEDEADKGNSSQSPENAEKGTKTEDKDEDEGLWGPDDLEVRYEFPALLYSTNWMSQGKYVYEWENPKGPVIWFFCCEPEEWVAKSGIPSELREMMKMNRCRRRRLVQRSRTVGGLARCKRTFFM